MGLGVPGQYIGDSLDGSSSINVRDRHWRSHILVRPLEEDVVRPSDTPVLLLQSIDLAALSRQTLDSPSSFILGLPFRLTLAAEGELTTRSHRYLQSRVHFATVEVEGYGIGAHPLLDGGHQPGAVFAGDDPCWLSGPIADCHASFDLSVVRGCNVSERELESSRMQSPQRKPERASYSPDR
jgi:hypothetical protein